MSGIGRCERAQWYNYKGYTPEELSGEVYLTFLQGHILEAVLVALLKLSGHTVEEQQKKHTLEGINGSQDCTIDGELVDIKTASAWSWENKFKESGISDDALATSSSCLRMASQTKERRDTSLLSIRTNQHSSYVNSS